MGQTPKDLCQKVEPLLLGRVELAAALGVSTATLDRLDSAGKVPRAIKLGGRKLWRRAEVEAWLAANAPERAEWELLRTTNGCASTKRHLP